MGMRLLNRMMKVRKLRPKLAAPPSTRGRVLDKKKKKEVIHRRLISVGSLLSVS